MKAEEFKAKGAEILSNLSDQGKASTILTELATEYDNTTAAREAAEAKAAQLMADNEQLRAANMKLFLSHGSVPAAKPITDDDDKPKPVDWSAFVDEKGRLK